MLCRLRPLLPRAQHAVVRKMATAARTDGFNEALPIRDAVAPALIAGIYGFAWYYAGEGKVRLRLEPSTTSLAPLACSTTAPLSLPLLTLGSSSRHWV